jgi:hypothetical protein
MYLYIGTELKLALEKRREVLDMVLVSGLVMLASNNTFTGSQTLQTVAERDQAIVRKAAEPPQQHQVRYARKHLQKSTVRVTNSLSTEKNK